VRDVVDVVPRPSSSYGSRQIHSRQHHVAVLELKGGFAFVEREHVHFGVEFGVSAGGGRLDRHSAGLLAAVEPGLFVRLVSEKIGAVHIDAGWYGVVPAAVDQAGWGAGGGDADVGVVAVLPTVRVGGDEKPRTGIEASRTRTLRGCSSRSSTVSPSGPSSRPLARTGPDAVGRRRSRKVGASCSRRRVGISRRS